MTARITNILPLLLLSLLCVGVVEGGYEILEYFVLRSPSERAAISDIIPEEKGTPAIDEQKEKHDYHIILQRNLFGPLPGEEESSANAAPDYAENLQSTSLNIVLMGTVSGGDGASRAIILDKSSRKQELYEQGDAIQGALVKEILRGKVILVYNGKDEMLDMSEAEKERSAFAAPVPRVGSGKKFSPNRVIPNRPAVSPRGTPRRVINRPRTIRPSRSIRTE